MAVGTVNIKAYILPAWHHEQMAARCEASASEIEKSINNIKGFKIHFVQTRDSANELELMQRQADREREKAKRHTAEKKRYASYAAVYGYFTD